MERPVCCEKKLPERNYYTIVRDGVSRRATAEQLRSYHDSEANLGDQGFPKASTSGSVMTPTTENDSELECLPLTVYGQTSDQVEEYENFRTFSDDETGAELFEDSDKRHRKAPARFPDGQWVRTVWVENMSVNEGINETEGARALLDLRYGGSDATIRSITSLSYPQFSEIDGGYARSTSLENRGSLLWNDPSAGDRGSHFLAGKNAGKSARTRGDVHVRLEMKAGFSLARRLTSDYVRRPSVSSAATSLKTTVSATH